MPAVLPDMQVGKGRQQGQQRQCGAQDEGQGVELDWNELRVFQGNIKHGAAVHAAKYGVCKRCQWRQQQTGTARAAAEEGQQQRGS